MVYINIRMYTICRIYILHVYQYNYIHIYSNHYIIGGIRLLGKYGQMVGSAVDFQAKCFSTCRTEKVEWHLRGTWGGTSETLWGLELVRNLSGVLPCWITKRSQVREKKQHEISGSCSSLGCDCYGWYDLIAGQPSWNRRHLVSKPSRTKQPRWFSSKLLGWTIKHLGIHL